LYWRVIVPEPTSSGVAGAATFKAAGGAAAGGALLSAIVVMLMTPPRSTREWAVGLISTVARAEVEHPFRRIRRAFGLTNVRCHRMTTNTAALIRIFALSNPWMARRRLAAMTFAFCQRGKTWLKTSAISRNATLVWFSLSGQENSRSHRLCRLERRLFGPSQGKHMVGVVEGEEGTCDKEHRLAGN
jgi:hypothetical protein